LWAGVTLQSAFDIQLRYESQHDSGLSQSRAFTLLVTNAKVVKIRRGIEGTWWVNCPKCDERCAPMITEGLENFDSAAKRESALLSELKATCPRHESQWSDSVEQIRERREQKKAQNGDDVEED
jgi:hypothetical protein